MSCSEISIVSEQRDTSGLVNQGHDQYELESVIDEIELIRRDAALAAQLAQEMTPEVNGNRFVRRSVRDPSLALLDRNDVHVLLAKIRESHRDTVVLKVKDLVQADINSAVMDEIILALKKNQVCQALYVQNLNDAIQEKQLKALVELLKTHPIWCLNIGETYKLSQDCWSYFCDALVDTYVTHLYVSEHVIDLDLKNKMRENIRKNRKKHDRHCSLANIRVIEKCTNMWWNPINAIRHQIEATMDNSKARSNKAGSGAAHNSSPEQSKTTGKKVLQPIELTPHHTAYWAEGVGKGGEKPWKFKCICGEVCSSYEHYRYHPIGRMYECTVCSNWSHVKCMLGESISDDDIEELENVMCSVCRTKARRVKLTELKDLNIVWENGRVVCGGEDALVGLEDPVDPDIAETREQSFDQLSGQKRTLDEE